VLLAQADRGCHAAHEANGDVVVDYSTGDVLNFVGYDASATFAQIDPFHGQVTYNAGASNDIITILNGAAINPADVVFT
jgi:hypothetical protein